MSLEKVKDLNQCQDYEKEDASKAALAIIRDVTLHIPMKLDTFGINASKDTNVLSKNVDTLIPMI